MTMPLYHFTDTVRLPWIVYRGELRPGRNKLGPYPSPEFVWASTDPRDDGSAAMHRGELYRDGTVHHIRFTLPEDQFIPWRDVPARYPSWTTDHIQRLERSGNTMRTSPGKWWCCVEPLSLKQVVAIDWRSYRSNQWKPFPQGGKLHTELLPMLVYQVGDLCFASQQVEGAHGEQPAGAGGSESDGVEKDCTVNAVWRMSTPTSLIFAAIVRSPVLLWAVTG